jgi:hypothetical protein
MYCAFLSASLCVTIFRNLQGRRAKQQHGGIVVPTTMAIGLGVDQRLCFDDSFSLRPVLYLYTYTKP